MNKYRIQIMNQLFKSNAEDQKKYRLKKVSSSEYKFYPAFGQRTEACIIDDMLKYSPALKENYEQYQRLKLAIISQCSITNNSSDAFQLYENKYEKIEETIYHLSKIASITHTIIDE